ncbi:outer membrane channel protein TolC [Providencia huaxiensis]|uniref:Outer membrane channel protein TolC n=1 Tax=Providencia huaxiensis TaxID=2027290 RepID=A0ABU2J0J1_9GAMM|nr:MULTISPECIES: outer membrane channel protein TolC [Providencia]AXH64209.1 outer membrane channel protein TolC [Providencia huaxiensis]MBQ0534354.1 outer membrane channel protein TolC [Providencia huaxiensis]MBQ0588937.1 outer membrane channel protein TolC [Providencia huaxiensis]MBZ3679656.1 outer membrane channel protein TolC [Providencia rettgeri]MCD2526503.1 outer membrane channel protein TolC [Providencia huaxiensis]
MKKLLPLLISMSFVGLSTNSFAEDLLQVYQKSKESNPELRKSLAERNQAFEKINESRSPLLPQLGLGAGASYGSGYRDARNTESTGLNASLKLTQVVFDMSKWRQLTIQEKTAGISDVTYQTSQQQLILNTATAYFNVLKAIDALSYIEANKEAVYRQLDQVTQRFNVGLVAITDVQNARANYDSVIAQEVAGRNELENAIEKLRQVSGVYYSQLASLNIDRFKTNELGDINAILKEAEERNLSLLSARLAQDVSRENIRLAETGHMPTVNLDASTTVTNSYQHGSGYNTPYGGSASNSYNGQNSIGLNLSIPLYTGGAVSSQVEQAQYGFQGASEQLESVYRNVIQLVRSSFNNVSSSISSINAYKQVVVSAQSSLDAMEAGYQVGTRTIVDVLTATTALYQAKQNLSNARYDYMINQLNIEFARGTLNEDDIARLNANLGKEISTSASSIIRSTNAPKMN